jgi:di/tricarboxylate transporter
MFETLLTAETLKAVMTLIILVASMYSFVSEKVPPDVTALLAMLALLLTGVLGPEKVFSGFSHSATISVAAILVVSAGIERTGALSFIARKMVEPFGRSELALTLVIMLAIGLLSAFINNTAAVAIFIPIVLDMCRRTGVSPGPILMPMAHAATFTGMCTLIGTSTNLVTHEFARSKGLSGFSMFELGRVGLPMTIAGFAYILLIGRRLLPRTRLLEDTTLERSGVYLSELLVLAGSPWIDQEVRPEALRRDFEVELLGLVREGKAISLEPPYARYQAGDSLRVRGPLKGILSLAAREGLELHRPESRRFEEALLSLKPLGPDARASSARDTLVGRLLAGAGDEQKSLAEIVVLPGSPLVGETLKAARFAERYDAVVLALHLRGGSIGDRPSTTPIRAGDLLVVEGKSSALKALAETPGFLVVGTPAHPEERPAKVGIAMLTFLGVIIVVSLGLLPIVTAATAGCAVLMLTGCLRPREAYQAIDLSIVFVLAGALALGTALEETGLTRALAKGLEELTGLTGPYVVLVAFFVASMLISEFMSNSGTAALLAPIAFSSATQMGINPMSLLAAVTFGSSAAFAIPIGYQTSLMIYGPGGYRFKDYLKMGIPLDLILTFIALWLIPRFWPLTPPP